MQNDQPLLLKTVGPGAVEEVRGNVDDENVFIRRNGNNVVAFLKNSFIRIDMTWSGGQLPHINFQICMPSELCVFTVSGHLGNCDGDPNNDISTPDNLRKWLIIGSSCIHSFIYFIFVSDAIRDQASSLFTYGGNFGRRKRQIPPDPATECTTFESCSGVPFTGQTFEDLTFTEAQRERCNNVRTCLYDLAITNNDEVAGLSRDLSVNSSIVQQTLSKQQ